MLSYIEFIRSKGVIAEIKNELIKAGDQKWDQYKRREPFRANDDLRHRLRCFDNENLKNIILTETKIVDFKDSDVLKLLDLLTPDNMNVFLKTSDKSQKYDKKNSRRMLDYR